MFASYVLILRKYGERWNVVTNRCFETSSVLYKKTGLLAAGRTQLKTKH